ncbi:TetR/AcrR family transcriptional regulator [Mycobacteroides abscessus]
MARPVDKAARRQAILDTGYEVLKHGGLPALQMREVARRAGLAAGTLYIYFPTKESLFAALYARRLNEIRDQMEQLRLAPASDLRTLFTSYATQYRDMYAQFGRQVDVSTLFTEKSVIDPLTLGELRSATSEHVDTMEGILRDFHVEQPELALPVLWSLLSGLAAHYAGPRAAYHRVGWEQALDFVADKLLGAMASAQEPSHAD